MTSEDYSQYVSRLASDLDEEPYHTVGGFMTSLAGALAFWIVLGGAVLGIYYGLPLLVRMV